MKVLITGLNGFTGLYLRQQLEQSGHEVVGLKSNLLDWSAVAAEVSQIQPHAAIHLAAISFVPSGDNGDVYSINTLGTQGLLNALAELPVTPQKVILASSSNVYGMTEGMISEERCPQPVNHYGCSKLSMEHIAATYGDRLPIVITRPFNYTGIGQDEKFLIPKIVSHFVDKKSIIELGNIEIERDFSDVRWVSYAYQILLEKGESGSVYNLCSGKATSIAKIIEKLNHIAGYDIQVVVNNDYVRKVDIKQQYGAPDKILSLCDKDRLIDFDTTLDWMFQEYLGNN